MSSYKILFETADLIPPPYSNRINVIIEFKNDSLKIDFFLEYTNRETLEEEEIVEEGFTLNDDVAWSGTLNTTWKTDFTDCIQSLKSSPLVENAAEDLIKIEVNDEVFYPKDKDGLRRFIEQLHQAVFESVGFEKPLFIHIQENSANNTKSTILNASFLEKKYSQTINNHLVNLNWNQLDEHLKLIFSGDFFYEKASNKIPSKSGTFVNLGDEWWFEVGKSLKINPSKIKGFIV